MDIYHLSSVILSVQKCFSLLHASIEMIATKHKSAKSRLSMRQSLKSRRLQRENPQLKNYCAFILFTVLMKTLILLHIPNCPESIFWNIFVSD